MLVVYVKCDLFQSQQDGRVMKTIIHKLMSFGVLTAVGGVVCPLRLLFT